MLTRAAAGAVLGALLAPVTLAVLTFFNPAIALDFDADLPRAITSGFYPAERTPAETFAWTAPSATITLRGIDRDAAWRCTARLRGARPAGFPEAQAAFSVDGITRVTSSPGQAYEDIDIDVPAQPGATVMTIGISTSPAFVPGPADSRELGVQVDRVACTPAGDAGVVPPAAAVAMSAAAGAAFGAVFALLSPMLILSLAGSALFAVAVAFVLNTGVASYSRTFLEWITPLALWISGPLILTAFAQSWKGRTIHPATGFVLAFSSAVLFIKILTLLHPSKDVVDAVFHAHRLEAVLRGNYYFTQPMPGGVQFPYAIGLYVAAMPWASLVTDHVALLRIVVCVMEALAAGLLYLAAVRNWGDRLAGAAAVVLYHAAPLPYSVIGNANLTYAFGQSAAVIAVAAVVIFDWNRRAILASAAVFALASIGFLSHVGIFPLLALTLFATGLLFWLSRSGLRAAAAGVLVATVLAAGFSVASYYAHFPEVYRSLNLVTGRAQPAPSQGGPAVTTPPAQTPQALTFGQRAQRAASLGLRGFGWPLLALAVMGMWLTVPSSRDRLTLALGGWGVSFALFVVFRLLAPVEGRYQRYADEFIERVYYATLPAVALLAGRAAAWGWQARIAWRLGVLATCLAAAAMGIQRWMAWIL